MTQISEQQRPRRQPFRRANMTEEQRAHERWRRQELDKRRRWRKGVVPRHMSLSATRPWEAAGVSRATWYRHRETGETIRQQQPISRQAVLSLRERHNDKDIIKVGVPAGAPVKLIAADLVPDHSFNVPTLSTTAVSMEEWSAADAVGHFAERAAILEYDGGYSRAESEARALDEIIQRFQWSRNAVWWEQFYRLKWSAA